MHEAWGLFKDRRATALLAGIVGLGLLLRLPGLGDSAYYDEIWTLYHMDAPDLGSFWALQTANDPPTKIAPVYFVTLFYWLKLTGGSLLSARIFSLIFGLATLPVVYGIGHRLGDRRTGLLAAFFTAMALPHIHFSVEVRAYALPMFLAALSVYSFVLLLESPSRWRWLLHGTVNGLLVVTHVFMTPLFVAQWLTLMYCRPHDRGLWVRWTAVHGAFLVGLLLYARQVWSPEVSDGAGWFERPGPRELANALVVYAGGRFTNWDPSGRFPWRFPLDELLAVFLVMAAGIAIAVRWRNRREDRPQFGGVVLLTAWLILPVALLYLLSQIRPFFVYRYELHSVFAAMLLLAMGVYAIPNRQWRMLAGSTLTVVFVAQLTALREPVRPDYAGAAALIEAGRAEGDVILAFKPYNALGLRFNSGMTDDEIRTVYTVEEVLAAVGEAHKRGAGAWIAVWRHDPVETLEEALGDRAPGFQRFGLGGLPSMFLYHSRP